MTKKTDFSKQEWQMLADGPEWVFAALAAADGNAAVTTKMKESKAFKSSLADYRSRSELMAEVLEDSSKASKETRKATLSDAEQAIEKINALLDSKVTAAEAADYRRFLLSIAESVAEATGESVLGLGNKFSKKEIAAMAKIKEALKPGKKAAAPTKVERKPVVPAGKKPAARKPIVSAGKSPVSSGRPMAAKQEVKVIATHKVEGNQTLSHLALKYYGKTTKPYWKLIHDFNKDVIGEDEKNIYPGLKLQIPELPADMKDKE